MLKNLNNRDKCKGCKVYVYCQGIYCAEECDQNYGEHNGFDRHDIITTDDIIDLRATLTKSKTIDEFLRIVN